MHALSYPTPLANRAPLNTLQMGVTAKANAASSTSSTSSGSNSSTSSADGLGTTFLNLLTEELQNQDPTDPVDSTAMVGQMISLNQLDQLISINQTLSQAQAGATASSSATPNSAAVQAAAAAATQPAAAAATTAPTTQLPFNPQTMMPVDMSHPGGLLAPSIPGVNAAAWNALQSNTPLNVTGRN